MTDDSLKRLLEADAERIEKRVDAIDNKVDELRSQVLQCSQVVAKAMMAAGEKVDSKRMRSNNG